METKSYSVVEGFFDGCLLIVFIQDYAIHDNIKYHQQHAHVTLKERESSHNLNPSSKKGIRKTSVASLRKILKCQQSRYPKSKLDERFHLLRSCNKKFPVEQVPPTFQPQFNPRRYQREQLLDRECFESSVLHHYHSHNLIPAVSLASDISNEQPDNL